MTRKTFSILFSTLAAVIIAMAVMNARPVEAKGWDTCHAMANANISWEQTFFSGAWGE